MAALRFRLWRKSDLGDLERLDRLRAIQLRDAQRGRPHPDRGRELHHQRHQQQHVTILTTAPGTQTGATYAPFTGGYG